MTSKELRLALQKQRELEEQVVSLTERIEDLVKLSDLIGLLPEETTNQVGLI